MNRFFPITTGDLMHVYGAFGAGVDYTVRLSVRLDAPVELELLRCAIDRAQRRYPYLSVRLAGNDSDLYYEENPAPIALHAGGGRVELNGPESHEHLWSVSAEGDTIHLDIFHGLCDGAAMYRLLATLLYEYSAAKYGGIERGGIWTQETPIDAAELSDPQDALGEADAAGALTPQYEPAFTLETDGGLTPSEPSVWDVEIPEDAFIRFTSANDASPGTMVSLLWARAIDALFPEREKEIVGAYVINARPMLLSPLTHHNCLSMAIFPYSDRIRKLPFSTQCTVYRGQTFIQSDEDRVRPALAQSALGLRALAAAAKTPQDKCAAFAGPFLGGEGLITYLVSYTGKWPHPQLSAHMREFWTHPSNTFSLMTEIGAAGGKIFLSLQQRFREDAVREAFLKELSENDIPCRIARRGPSDVAHLRGL